MKKSLAKFMACFSQIDTSIKPKFEEYIEPLNDSQMKRVLDEIFAVDPDSGLPKGDLQYWLSSDGNPQIKQWLENNLLMPRVKSSGSSIEGVTDDMIVEMSRKPGESADAYSARLVSIYESAKAEYEASLQNLDSNM